MVKINLNRQSNKVRKVKNNIHNRLISKLEKRLENYTRVEREMEYGPYDRPTGEIDLIAVNHNYVLLFEMKSFDTQRNYHRALNQLNRAVNNFDEIKNKRVFKFYVTPGNIKWIKNKRNLI